MKDVNKLGKLNLNLSDNKIHIPVHEDNQATIEIAKEYRICLRTKFINIMATFLDVQRYVRRRRRLQEDVKFKFKLKTRIRTQHALGNVRLSTSTKKFHVCRFV